MAKDSIHRSSSPTPFESPVPPEAKTERVPDPEEVHEYTELPDEVSPTILRSQQAFREALPQLLRTRYRQWAAVHKGEIIEFARSKERLYHKVESRGIAEHEILLRCILPPDPDPEDVDVTPAYDHV